MLSAAGFLLEDDSPADGYVDDPGRLEFESRAVFGTGDELDTSAYFKRGVPLILMKDSGDHTPTSSDLTNWRTLAWNYSLAPLLWIIAPEYVLIFDSYDGRTENARPLATLSHETDDALGQIRRYCSKASFDTGSFWSSEIGSKIDRSHGVDRELLRDIADLEDRLVSASADDYSKNASRFFAQDLILRSIFAWYLLDRGFAEQMMPPQWPCQLEYLFESIESTKKLFEWLSYTFNGDVFKETQAQTDGPLLTTKHLALLRAFARSEPLAEGSVRLRLFKFRFDVIPVELISSIYEQFSRSNGEINAKQQSLHYTPIELVNLIVDPVLEGIGHDASVIDPACGSGVFLVESLRRLVAKKTGGRLAPRRLVRGVLREQLYGIDINSAALKVAAFSLYLAALELDSEPMTADTVRFEPLIGVNLFVSDAIKDPLPIALREITFAAVLGNPPWTYVNHKTKRTKTADADLQPRRSPDHEFVALANRLAHGIGRIGMIVKATPFFTSDPQAVESRSALFRNCAPATFVNLSRLRNEGLFKNAVGPAALFFARCGDLATDDRVLVGSIPWTRTFKKNGVFAFGISDLKPVPLKALTSSAGYLKTAVFATNRDALLLRRLESECTTIAAFCDKAGIRRAVRRGQGFQVEGRPVPSPPDFFGKRVVDSNHYTPLRIDTTRLGRFNHRHLHHRRSPGIFEGPVLLCPKGDATLALERGRYSVALCQDDVLYTQSFYGISFKGVDVRWARVLCAIMNSAVATHQLAFRAGWGVERSTTLPQDISSFLIPHVEQITEEMFVRIDAALERLEQHNSAQARLELDAAVYDLYDLDEQERILVDDSLTRALPLLFNNRAEYRAAASSPTDVELREYGHRVVSVVNEYLVARGVHHLTASIWPNALRRRHFYDGTVAAVKFTMLDGRPKADTTTSEDFSDIDAVVDALTSAPTIEKSPYRMERRQLRMYAERKLVIVKPAERQYWTQASAMDDADHILADHWLAGNVTSAAVSNALR